MVRLPVIVGFGGINPAGRSSFHHAYRRLVIDALSQRSADATYASLASLMGHEPYIVESVDGRQQLRDGTLIRQLESALLDADAIEYNQPVIVSNTADKPLVFEISRKLLPEQLPEGWHVELLDERRVRVEIHGEQQVLMPALRSLKVQAAGQLPSGFHPGARYASHNHPRGLQMTVYAASDALSSMGIEWEQVRERVAADQISVYAGSGMSQLDMHANGGMVAARFNGKRVTSKQCPFGFAEMPADFINAYVLGSLGATGTSMGACASFLYNLRQGMIDIQTGRSRVAIVGNSEAPLVPDVFEGYAAMSALATDRELTELDGGVLDYRRACRPFGENCGFTLAESAQFVVLFDDALALEMGALVHGSLADVFVNADGFKKSISAPGVGNYLTVAKAMACARAIVGEDALRQRSFVQAHGTGTPQNRVTESDILDRAAGVFGIDNWPVVAVKSYLGHSIGVAGGDQVTSSLGVWAEGLLPGIGTIDGPADDVSCERLDISAAHKQRERDELDVAIINSKGFGGNNATATLLAPHITERMLRQRHGEKSWSAYRQRAELTLEQSQRNDAAITAGQMDPVYLFDHNVLGGEQLAFDAQQIVAPGFAQPIDLQLNSPYSEWLD